MDDIKGQYLENAYTVLTPLKNQDSCSTFLVQNKASKSLAVKKQVSGTQFALYQQMQKLSHPNLARILETYCVGSSYYILEEYISGTTLESMLENGHRFSEEELLYYMDQLCSVLSYLHSHRVIHRDITPDNLVISSDSILKLIDFGISRTKKEDQAKDTTLLGTVGYAAPEQFGFGQTDERTDIYALGVLLNVLLTGELPLDHLTGDPHYRRIIRKCTALDPDNRYPSILSLHTDLHSRRTPPAALTQPPLTPRRHFPGIFSHIPGFRSGSPLHMAGAVISYTFLLFLGFAAAFRPLQPDDTRLEMWTVVIFFFYIPWAICVDAGHYSKRLTLFQETGPFTNLLLRAGLVLVSILICMALIYIESILF